MDRTDHQKEKSNKPLYEIKDLCKVFAGADHAVHALRGIDLTIYEGEIFGIIGLSGAGKSTLIRCLNLLERPTEGQVYFRGADLTRLEEKDLLRTRRKIGMIFQNFHLMQQRTALENIRFPLEISGIRKKEATERALERLRMVGLPEKEQAYPCELSGGQQQRIAIARALASDPDVLLCDEVTSALDPMTSESILALLKSINETLGVTIVIITHEMSVVQAACHRVAVIDEGQIAESGEVEQVFLHPRSSIAKELIYPKGELLERLGGHHYLRIVFDGISAHEPVIANMILACQTPVSILSADSRSIDGKAYGQMIIQIPESETDRENIIAYLKGHGMTAESVSRAYIEQTAVSEGGAL